MTALAAVRSLPGGGHAAALRAAVELSAAAESPELLSLLAASACRAAGVARCAVYLHAANGRFRGCGRLSRRACERRAPADRRRRRRHVHARDRRDARTGADRGHADRSARRRRARCARGRSAPCSACRSCTATSVLGLLFLDPAGAPFAFTDDHVEAAAAIGRIAGDLLAARAAASAATRASATRSIARTGCCAAPRWPTAASGRPCSTAPGIGGVDRRARRS